ncbi:MAG: hypothetical protein WCV90_00915 [Candidatus Woesearchaeota archaeon]|jgi:hypothetical protein
MRLEQHIYDLLNAEHPDQVISVAHFNPDRLRSFLKSMSSGESSYNHLLFMQEGYIHIGNPRMRTDIHFSGIDFTYQLKHSPSDPHTFLTRYLPFGGNTEVGELITKSPSFRVECTPSPNYRDREQNIAVLTLGIFPYSVKVELLPLKMDEGRYQRITGVAYRVNPLSELEPHETHEE